MSASSYRAWARRWVAWRRSDTSWSMSPGWLDSSMTRMPHLSRRRGAGPNYWPERAVVRARAARQRRPVRLAEPVGAAGGGGVAAVAVGGVLLAVMIAVSGYAAVVLPGSARVPLHFGSHQRVVLASKRAGLVIWPAAGAV